MRGAGAVVSSAIPPLKLAEVVGVRQAFSDTPPGLAPPDDADGPLGSEGKPLDELDELDGDPESENIPGAPDVPVADVGAAVDAAGLDCW